MAETLADPRPVEDDCLVSVISGELLPALEHLAQARRYAGSLACDRWEFAVELDRLLATGLTTSDLRWLIKCGLIEHRRETTKTDAPSRTFASRETNLAFVEATCFVLTDEGVRAMQCNDRPATKMRIAAAIANTSCESGSTGLSGDVGRSAALLLDQMPSRGVATHRLPENSNVVPNWDRVARMLLVGDSLVKRYRVPSPNQEALLDAFQEEGWPASIDDPLTPLPDQQPKRRLRDTIKCLNLNQTTRLLRFRGDGTGQRVLWELLAAGLSLGQNQETRRAA